MEGGHFVPDDKVSSRILRLLENVKAAIPFVDRFVALDNSYREKAFNRQLEYRQGELNFQSEKLQSWAQKFMAEKRVSA